MGFCQHPADSPSSEDDREPNRKVEGGLTLADGCRFSNRFLLRRDRPRGIDSPHTESMKGELVRTGVESLGQKEARLVVVHQILPSSG